VVKVVRRTERGEALTWQAETGEVYPHTSA
jgi:hypothetical protein